MTTPLASEGGGHGRPLFYGAVLVGGKSRRMGADKAWIEIDGLSMAARTVRALNEAGADSVAVVGPHSFQGHFTRSFGGGSRFDASGLATPAFVQDLYPGEGPLGAIITALAHFSNQIAGAPVLVLASDLPLIRARSLTALTQALGPLVDRQGDAAMTMLDGRRQPLAAGYGSHTRAHLHERFDAGERSPLRAAAGLDVIEVIPAVEADLVDADDPETLQRLLQAHADQNTQTSELPHPLMGQ